MKYTDIKYNSSVAGYLFRVYLFAVICTPVVVILFFDKFDSIANHFGDSTAVYFNAFILGAAISLPAIILTLIFGFMFFNKVKDLIIFKGILLFIFIFLITLSFNLANQPIYDSITRSTGYQMTFVFLYFVASFAYKLERKEN